MHALYGKVLGKQVGWDIVNYYSPIYIPSVDIIHTFNTVCNVNKHWIVTFESTMPRTSITGSGEWKRKCMNGEMYMPGKLEKKCFNFLQGENCLGMLALSASTLRFQTFLLDSLDKNADVDIEAIKRKTLVIHPPQEILISMEDVQKKYDSVDCINFMLIGADFFRKGGAELVDVLSEFRLKGANILLTVVSKLNYGDYASGATVDEYRKYKEILSNSGWITWYDSLPNDRVLEIAKKAHVGCLPTLADTYGYSVLELQACGCGVLSTDIRSLPEINNDVCGWICHLPKDNICGEARHFTSEEKQRLRAILREELRKRVGEILEHPELLKSKGISSLERIMREHHPDDYAKKLLDVYGQ